MTKPTLNSVAPMMDWTDRHCRVFHRALNPDLWLYSEMVTTGALRHGNQARHLDFSPIEHPVALQLGGSDPDELAFAAQLGERWGYDQINLNCGCPSNRVQSGRFGACLMAEPETVLAACASMRAAVKIPVTVKCRIGIDNQDSEQDLDRFIDCVSESGVSHFIVHARKAWLQGLSPKENREIPPLDYDRVRRLKQRRPDLTLILNGGLTSFDTVPGVDGVMVGRSAYTNPWILADGKTCRHTVIETLVPYLESQLALGVPLSVLIRPMLGLFNGIPGARSWRRFLSENAPIPGAGLEILFRALENIQLFTPFNETGESRQT